MTRYRIGASRSLSLALFARRATIPISTNECHLYTGPAIGYKTMGASLQVSFFFSFLSFFFFLPLILYHALYCFIFLCFFSSFFSPLFPLPPPRPLPPPASPLSLSLISRSIRISTPCIDARTLHTRDNKRMRSTIQNGILSAKIENINFDSATRHVFFQRCTMQRNIPWQATDN